MRVGIPNNVFVTKASIKLMEFVEFAILLHHIMAQIVNATLAIMAIEIVVINVMQVVANAMDLKQISA